MTDGNITAIIAGTSSIIVAVITVVVKDWLDRRKKSNEVVKEENMSPEELGEMMIIQEWLDEFRDKNAFERAAIYQFHNGGKFFQGKSMKKMSMTYESTAPGYEKTKRYSQNILASEYPWWVSKMVKSRCFETRTEDLNHKDKREFQEQGIQQFITTPIFCLKGNLVGFLAGYNISDIDENAKHKFAHFVEEGKFISGYLS
jgi:hypothetical protein